MHVQDILVSVNVVVFWEDCILSTKIRGLSLLCNENRIERHGFQFRKLFGSVNSISDVRI